MNWSRSRNEGEKVSYRQDNKLASNNISEYSKNLDSVSITNSYSIDNIDSDRFILPRKNIRFRTKSRWFNFNRGLLWGGIIGSNVIFSASCGAALTKIDVVEKTMTQTITRIYPASKKFLTPKNITFSRDKLLEDNNDRSIRNRADVLERSFDILLLETEFKDKRQTKSFTEFDAESKTILLLQLDPQLNRAIVTNIPLDSRVNIPGFGWGTIDDAYKYGGASLVSKSVSQLLDNITIDRYVEAKSASLERLISSGRITLNDCDDRFEDCSNITEQISRQEIAVETIRQRLNVPAYLRNFERVLSKTRSNLNTNLSLQETMAIANFIKELESDDIDVNLVSGYIKGNSIALDSNFTSAAYSSPQPKFKNLPIAVQNTTNSPELGMQFVSYLRRLDFQDVYLVQHTPLNLSKTKIVTDRSQLARAKQLKITVGFGKLESTNSKRKPLTIQIGEDIRHFPLEGFSN